MFRCPTRPARWACQGEPSPSGGIAAGARARRGWLSGSAGRNDAVRRRWPWTPARSAAWPVRCSRPSRRRSPPGRYRCARWRGPWLPSRTAAPGQRRRSPARRLHAGQQQCPERPCAEITGSPNVKDCGAWASGADRVSGVASRRGSGDVLLSYADRGDSFSGMLTVYANTAGAMLLLGVLAALSQMGPHHRLPRMGGDSGVLRGRRPVVPRRSARDGFEAAQLLRSALESHDAVVRSGGRLGCPRDCVTHTCLAGGVAVRIDAAELGLSPTDRSTVLLPHRMSGL